MKIKSNIKSILKKLNESKAASENKIKEIKDSEKYAEDYKVKLIQDEKQNFANERFKIRDEVAGLIETTKKELLDTRKPMARDLTFEVRLSNALKAIELAGKNMNKGELKAIVEPFEKDYSTVRTFFNVFRTMGINTEGVIPVDGIDQQINTLDNIKNDLMDSLKYDNTFQASVAAGLLPEDTEGEA